MFYRSIKFHIILFLIFITLAVFWQLPSHEFVNIDDGVYVTNNPHIKEGLSIKSLKWAFTSFHAEFWHPVTWLSYMLDFELYGMNPGGYLLTNLLLHIVNTLLLFLFLNKTTGCLWRSALVAALFAVHPLHVESVAWIAERKDLLSTLFWMLTLLFYAHYVNHPKWSRYAGFSLCFILGLMAKPMLVTLPFVLLLVDYWPLGRFSSLKQDSHEKPFNRKKVFEAFIEKIPLFMISILFGIIAIIAQKSGRGLASPELFPIITRLANALTAYTGYLRKTFYPFDLAVFYPYAFQFDLWRIILSFSLLIFITLTAVYFIKKFPYFITGWLWFLGTLVPVIGVVKFGGAFAMADRYTYIPLIGVFVIFAWGGYDVMHRTGLKKAFISILAGICILFIMMSAWMQVTHWKNSIALFHHALEVTKRNFLAHKNLGRAYIDQGRIDLALPHFQNALDIEPENPTAHLNIGTCYLFYGEFDKAVTHFQKALTLYPAYTKAMVNLEKALSAQKNMDLAISIVKTAIQLNEKDPIPHKNLGDLFKKKGDWDKAVWHYKKAVELKPGYEDAKHGLENLNKK